MQSTFAEEIGALFRKVKEGPGSSGSITEEVLKDLECSRRYVSFLAEQIDRELIQDAEEEKERELLQLYSMAAMLSAFLDRSRQRLALAAEVRKQEEAELTAILSNFTK